MKRFILPGLAIVVVFSLVLAGWFFFGKERRVSLGPDSAGQKMKDEAQTGTKVKQEEEPEWVARYILTPGPVKREVNGQQVITSVNGRFVRFEEIEGSADKYLVLEAESDIPRLRVIFSKDPERGIEYTTQLNIMRPTKNQVSIVGAMKELGNVDIISTDTLSLVLRPGIWVKAILYRSKDGMPKQDKDGAYYVSAITTKEQ
jgi:hypothetical protein